MQKTISVLVKRLSVNQFMNLSNRVNTLKKNQVPYYENIIGQILEKSYSCTDGDSFSIEFNAYKDEGKSNAMVMMNKQMAKLESTKLERLNNSIKDIVSISALISEVDKFYNS